MKTIPHTDGSDLIRLLVWIVADGTMVDERKYKPKSIKRRIQFKLSRPDKIEKLEALLTRMSVPFTKKESAKTGVNKLQPYVIRIYGSSARNFFELLNGAKRIPEWFSGLGAVDFMTVLETIADTDGHIRHKTVRWTTTSPDDVKTITSLCINQGVEVEHKICLGASGFKKDCKPQYRVTIWHDIRPEVVKS